MALNKGWVIGGIGAALALVALSTSRLARFSKEFILEYSIRVHKFTWTSVMLAVDTVFKNPTDATLTLKHPTISLYDSLANKAANQPMVSSTVQATVYTIKPNTETKLQPIYITISALDLSLGVTIKNLVAKFIAGQPVVLYARALTQVNGTVPVVKEFLATVSAGSKPTPTTKAISTPTTKFLTA